MNLLQRFERWIGDVVPVAGRPENLDPADREILLGYLASDERGRRWLAAEALGEGYPGKKGVAALGETLSDPDPILRWEAGAALVRLGTSKALRILLEGLSSDRPEEQAAAADALGQWAPDPAIGSALIEALDSPDSRVRRNAAEALVGQPAPEALARLLSLLEADPDPLVRRAAAMALGRLGDPSARKALAAVMEDPDTNPLVREAAGQAYQRLPGTEEPPEIREEDLEEDPSSE